MKKLVSIVFLISATTLLFANLQVIKTFKATTNGDAVNVEWETISEKNVSSFELQRRTNGSFKTIHSLKAKGEPSTYKFTDSDSFTKEIMNDNIQAENVASYRIKIIYADNSPFTYTNEIDVTRNISTIRRTLGMIKEMFK